MPKISTLAATLALVTAVDRDNCVRAQNVILSEIVATGADRWIELDNRDGAAADLSGWSLYLATATPGRPGTYWWPFPAGTLLLPGAFLRVHWFQAAPAAPPPDELWTGDTAYDFLFGLGSEALPPTAGALALLRSQQNAQMNSPGVFVDFVEYGAASLPREALAVQALLWLAGRCTPAPGPGQSLARDPGLIGLCAPDQQWLLDNTPTPLGENVGAAAATAVGTPCAVPGHHLLGAPELRASSTPVLGNAAFALQVTNTTGVLLEHCIVAYSAGPAPPGQPPLLPPVVGGGCSVLIDIAAPLATTWLHAQTTRTNVPLPVPPGPAGLAGMTLYAQAIVFELWASAWPPYEGATNALRITLGN